MMQKLVIAGLGSLSVALIVILVISTLATDKNGPVIEHSTEQFTYTEGMDTTVLLSDVKAKDSKDGDVSSTLIIENIVKLDEVDSAVVIYAAKDKANNITKKERIIDYVANSEEVNSSQVTQVQAGAESTQVGAQEEGTTAATGQVNQTASEEDTSNTTADAKEKALEAGIPYLELITNEVTLKKGDTFNYANYIKEAVDDKDNVYKKVRVSKTYDMSKAGKYEVEFYVVDSEGNNSNKEKLTLTVED